MNRDRAEMSRMSRVFYNLIRLGLMCFVAGNAFAAMYKWVDEEGNTHYSERPPPGIETETIKPPPKVDTERALKDLEERKNKFNESEETRVKKAEDQEIRGEEVAMNKRNCELARDKLAKANEQTRVYAQEKDGTRRRITEEERQERIAAAQKDIAEFCK